MSLAMMDAEATATSNGEDAVLLREFAHRAGNELALALAGLRMAARPGGVDDARRRLLEDAATRVEASAALHRVLARPLPARVDAGAWVSEVCAALAPRAAELGGCLDLDVEKVVLDGAIARRVVLVAAELVANAVRHALPGGGRRIRVSLGSCAGSVVLRVGDDGPGIVAGRPRKGGGLGSGIVDELVRLAGGFRSVETGPAGTSFRVLVPARPASAPEARRA